MNLNTLPLSVQEDVRASLCAYSTVYVTLKADGKYNVTAALVLHNGPYDKFIGEFTCKEVFTLEERIVNYVNEFRDFPYHRTNGAHYTGKKDWAALNSDWTKAEMVDGNIIFH